MWKDAWKLHNNRRLHACSLSHLAYWAFMFTAEGSSTYYAVYVIRRAFLSSDKELGLKWHVLGLVGSVSHTGVRFAVWFSSLSRGPSDGYQHHMHVLNGLMFVCIKARADHGLVFSGVIETFLVTSQGIQLSCYILCKVSRHCLSQHSLQRVFWNAQNAFMAQFSADKLGADPLQTLSWLT